jgi:hypothetical protein
MVSDEIDRSSDSIARYAPRDGIHVCDKFVERTPGFVRRQINDRVILTEISELCMLCHIVHASPPLGSD